MKKISSTLLGSFRHQLWLEHIEVLEEGSTDTCIWFAIEGYSIDYWQLDNLRRIAPVNILLMYHEGNLRLHLTILKDS